MVDESLKELIATAKENFDTGKYQKAESILNQLILRNSKEPIIFQMLGTIYYDRGKFNKAVRAFKRALEIDPSFTDASLGLSIILNDLGRYDEGKKVFEEAQTHMASSKSHRDPYINDKLSTKHDELGELYFQYKRFNEALEQFYKALALSQRQAEISMKIVECYLRLNVEQKAIKELENIIKQHPDFVNARLKLGKIYSDKSKSHLARKEWEKVLKSQPENEDARQLLKQLNEGENQFEVTL